MKEIIDTYLGLGISSTIIIVVLYLVVKYVPKFLDEKLKLNEKRSYYESLLMKTVENNTVVMHSLNSTVENNTKIIDNYNKHSHKLEQKVDMLIAEIHKGNTNIEIIKERK